MFLPGQKVVCVDDVFPDAIKKYYWKLPVKGVTYTVRDLVPGIDPCGAPGEMCVYLVELLNPCSDKPPYPERGFKAERFRPLETDDETAGATAEVTEELPAVLATAARPPRNRNANSGHGGSPRAAPGRARQHRRPAHQPCWRR